MANLKGEATRPLPTVAERALAGLAELKDALDSKQSIASRFTVRTIELNLEPEGYTGEEVRHLRETLNVSQAVFAELLCVSVHTVRAWESNKRNPPGMARRLFDEIRADPGRWIDYLRSIIESRQNMNLFTSAS